MQETNFNPVINESYVHGQVFPNVRPPKWPGIEKASDPDWLPNYKLDIGLKFDENKPRMDLLDPEFLEDMAEVLTAGARKYAAHNWRKGINTSRTIAAIYRHLGALNRGEDIDEDTGCHHEACIAVNCQFLNWMLKNKPEMDDRWKP